MTEKQRGILYMIISSISFAFMSVMVKLSGGAVPLPVQLLFRTIFTTIIAFFMVKFGHHTFKIKKRDRLPIALRCVFGFLGMSALFYASTHLHISDTMILQKLNPFFVTLFAFLWLNEKPTWKKIGPLILAFIGAYIIINPGGNYQLVPALVGVLAAFAAGLAYSMLSKLKGRVSGVTIIFYFSLFSTVAVIPWALKEWTIPDTNMFLYLVLIGVFASLGQYFLTLSYQLVAASEITLYDYTGAVVSPVLDMVFFSALIPLRGFLGMILVIGSGILSYYLNRDQRIKS